MAADDTKRAVEDEARLLVKSIEAARGKMRQLNLPYPGGDVCPQRVLVGLSGLLSALATFEVITTGDDCVGPYWSADETLALGWLHMWVDAGAAMLPRERR